MQTSHLLRKTAVVLAATALSFAGVIGSTAMAQDKTWPSGPVKVVMHTKAGGSSDVFMRTLAKSLEPEIGQPVVVINSPGGAGAAQLARVRAAAPDGLTLGINTLTPLTGMLTNLKGVFSLDDFSWIASTQVDPNLIWTAEDSPYRNLNDLIAAAKRSDKKISVGGFGSIGSTQYIALSMLERAAGVEFEWVAFNATPDIVAAVLGGHIDVGMSNLSGAQSYFDAGRLHGLGVLAADRLDALPDVATFEEQGYQVNNDWVQVRGVFGPAGIPEETQQQIADAFHRAMKDKNYQQYARNSGVIDSWMGPEAYKKFIYSMSDTAEVALEKAGVK
ncbi:tripartite tricarboxylate transporter substrate binding protein [Salinicola tamaricis]|uniref:tripartite tricarboxylate transporter substrate binding protein n=1 Tax=Salinicola tamaricis TaxID=1771309 RepID=UPI000D09B0E2|nr:tripartite tricarboxylate transporter substrate binding protein [Salinicola tamaricis]